jgi:hypothetical protein
MTLGRDPSEDWLQGSDDELGRLRAKICSGAEIRLNDSELFHDPGSGPVHDPGSGPVLS